MTSAGFKFIDARNLFLHKNDLRKTLSGFLEPTMTNQITIINFLRIEAEAPATFREFLSLWVSEFRYITLLFINVRSDFRVNLINEETASLLSKHYLVIPVFDQYCKCMDWIGLPKEGTEVGLVLTNMLSGKECQSGMPGNQSGLEEILKRNPGLFAKPEGSWSGAITPEAVFEAEIKNEIENRGAHIEAHIQLSPKMHTQEYIEAIRFIEDCHFIERLARQLFSLIRDSIDELDCIVTFGYSGAILALALRSVLRSQRRELPYIVFKDEDNPFPIKGESLTGKRALLLFDVICAGGLVEKLSNRIEGEDGEVSGIITVVDIDIPKETRYGDRIRALCHYAFKIVKPEDCDHCKRGDAPKQLYSYYRNIRDRGEREIITSVTELKNCSGDEVDFWRMVDNSGALAEHVSIKDKNRHYFFYIDTFAIFNDKEHMTYVVTTLLRQVVEKIHPMPLKIVLLHAPNLSAQLLATELRECWVTSRDLGEVSGPQDIYVVGAYVDEGNWKVHEEGEKLIDDDIVIIDDGANTGETLRALITLCNRKEVKRINACIFEDRLTFQERDAIVKLLQMKGGQLISLFRIPIPTFIRNPGDCPICKERNYLSDISSELTTAEAQDYCSSRIKKLKPIEGTEADIRKISWKGPRGPSVKMWDLSLSSSKALILHLKGKLSGEQKSLIPSKDLSNKGIEPLMKVVIVETLNEAEVKDQETSQVLMDELIRTKDIRIFESIMRAFSNAFDWGFVEKLKYAKIKNIPAEMMPFLAFIGELCELKNGRFKGKYWSSLKGKVPEIPEERIEQLERASKARGGLVGKSEVLNRIWTFIEKAGPDESSVLITGETGVGKELVAHAIHTNSQRKDGPFHKIEVTSVNNELVESELFGHAKGAFTGAVRNKPGKVELAHKGSLFLDEIGDLHGSIQPKLLRFIESKEFERVGEIETRNVDCRIIAATNKNLEELIRQGKFREDLYYRLKKLEITIPPLRERREDIPSLVAYFLENDSKKRQIVRSISKEAMKKMVDYEWPGNVRELQSCIERSCVFAKGETIKTEDLNISVGKNLGLKPIERIREMEEEEIVKALNRSRGNQTQAAVSLGMKSEKALRDRMKKLKIVNPYSTKRGRPPRRNSTPKNYSSV